MKYEVTKEKRAEYRERYLSRHREEINARRREWWARTHKKNKRPRKTNRSAYAKAYFETHKEERKAYYEKWRKAHWEEIKQKIYKASDKNKKQIDARNKVNNAIRLGKLVKQPCEVCGKLEVEAHHKDYNYPLDVNWLCRDCHTEWHKNNTPIYAKNS